MKKSILVTALTLTAIGACISLKKRPQTMPRPDEPYLSPCALAASKDGKTLYVAEHTGMRVAAFDVARGAVSGSVEMPGQPTGLALSPDGGTLYVSCAAPEGRVWRIKTTSMKPAGSMCAGNGATSPVLSPDGGTLYVCNRFDNCVGVMDASSGKERSRIPVAREPVAAALTPDGRRLLVANHLPAGRADLDYVSAVVSVIDTSSGKLLKDVTLPNGSGGLRGICISPDGKHAYVTHVLARYHMPTTQLERGWMNTAGLSIIDVERLERVNTVLLDDVDRGSANPWAVASTADGKFVCATHAGTQEVSIIDVPALLEKLAKMPQELDEAKTPQYTAASVVAADVPNDLSFLVDVRRRIRLKGNGPRSIAVIGDRAYVGEYFTDTLSIVRISMEGRPDVSAVELGPKHPLSVRRTGEMLFNDASLCFQGWQSCASCHPDVRADGLNWDLLNDGMGNPKNAKSLLLSHETPPVMISGVRPRAEVAVRAGIRYIQFAVRPEEDAVAVDEYLKAVRPVPSPHLCNGELSKSARRGRKLFHGKAHCSSCHNGRYYTDMKMYDVGTRGVLDRRDDFDTPALTEIWRTAPYLHDGRSATMMDVLTKDNPKDKHGATSQLMEQELKDLAEYVLSL